MNFNIDINNLEIGQTNNNKFMKPGIHENAKMSDILIDESKNNNKFISFSFINENNEKVTYTEWEPKNDTNKDEDYKVKIEKVIKRLGQIVVSGKYASREQYNGVVANALQNADFFTTLTNSIKALLENNNYNTKLVRVKVVYKGKYTNIPNYHNIQFIESMDVSKADSLIQMLSIDKTERPEPDAESEDLSNPFDVQEEVELDI